MSTELNIIEMAALAHPEHADQLMLAAIETPLAASSLCPKQLG